nr:YeeE/YedE thiosulfate transporter family protein [Ancylobacter sp. FA202]
MAASRRGTARCDCRDADPAQHIDLKARPHPGRSKATGTTRGIAEALRIVSAALRGPPHGLPRRPQWRDIAAGLAGGVLMGWGGMTALGCTVGVLLSGIHAGALSGWVFLVAAFAGLLIGLPLRRWISGVRPVDAR